MKPFVSALGPKMESMLLFRDAMGFSRSAMAYPLGQFDRFCAANYPDLNTLSKESVLQWIEAESQHEHSGMRRKAVAIRQLGKYLDFIGESAYILPNHWIPSTHSYVPYIFTDAELKRLFCAIDEQKPPRSHPLFSEVAPVLFRLIYTCGLRLGEGRDLKVADINFDTGEILITHNKQRKERVVVMSDAMLALCLRYNARRKIFGANSAFFFPSSNGMPYRTGLLDSYYKKCWIYANPNVAAANLPKARIYDLRHRFATATLHKWLDEGRDLYAMLPYLRSYMGHATFSSTAYYIHLLPENLVNSSGIDWTTFDKMFPEVYE